MHWHLNALAPKSLGKIQLGRPFTDGMMEIEDNMWRLRRVLRQLSIVAMLAVSFSGAGAQDKNMTLFQHNIETISNSWLLDLEVPSGLFDYSEFRMIWEKPEQFLEAAVQYIVDPKNPERSRLIAAYAMQKLPADEYFRFCDVVYEAYEAGTVNETILQTSMFPVYDFSTTTAENFARENVKNLLHKARVELIKREQAQLAGYVDRILSGKAAEDVLRMRSMGQLPARKQ